MTNIIPAPATEAMPAALASQPCIYLWKDVIRAGRYRHPSRQFTIHVDRKRLDHWSRTFARMSANGVRVHIPADHSDAAADNRGYVLALKRVGNRLMALCQFIGADAARDAARNDVSIGVARAFVDGKGQIYRDAIVHVALTPVPVVPGQGAFFPAEAFSAARQAPTGAAATLTGAAPAGVMMFSAANLIGRADMAQNMLPCGDQTLSALHDLVPGLSDVPDEQKLEQLLQYLQTLLADSDRANQDLADRDQRIEALSQSARVNAPRELEPPVRQALLEAIKAKRDLCVSRGALIPAVADALLARLAPAEGVDAVIGLSLETAPISTATLALSVFTDLAENRPLTLGERTASQARGLAPLARTVPGESKPPVTPLYEKMAAMADGKSVAW